MTLSFDALCDRARALPRGRRAVLGITGAPGAGKTHLVERLLEHLLPDPPDGLVAGSWVAHVPMDGYHLSDHVLRHLGRTARKGAPDTFDPAGFASLLERFMADDGKTLYAPTFDRTIDEPIAAGVCVPAEARLLITEGNYLLLDQDPWPMARAQLTQVWFCDTESTRRRQQLVARHVAYGRSGSAAEEFALGSDEANARLVAADRSKADLIIPEVVMATLPSGHKKPHP